MFSNFEANPWTKQGNLSDNFKIDFNTSPEKAEIKIKCT